MAGTFGKRTSETGAMGFGMPASAAPRPQPSRPQPRASAPVASSDDADYQGSGAPAAEGYSECPFCAEQILSRAKKCRHCGETVDVAMRKAEEALRIADRPAPQQVFMNGGASGVYGPQLRPFGHGLHIFLTFITAGAWLPVWLIVYILRNRAVYF